MKKLFNKNSFRYKFSVVKTGMHIGIPVLLILLPAGFFDHGQSISLFELAGAEDYYSKGMTRAVMHLIHLNFETAWQYNRLSFIVLPLIGWVWIKSFFQNYRRTQKLRILYKAEQLQKEPV